jgi:hypothetical protein
MPTQTTQEDHPILVIGGTGHIADAIRRRLRASCQLREMRRGDDIDSMLAGISTILVLEAAAVPPPSRTYQLAIDAVCHGLPGSSVKSVVVVTCMPVQRRRRRRWLAQVEQAEQALVVGYDKEVRVLILRCDVVVGTPILRGPSDPYLFSPHMPGNGAQECQPILLDDLLDAVVAAVTATPPPSGILELHGPQRLSVKSLLEALNPGKKIKASRRLTWQLSPARLHIPDDEMPASGPPSVRTALETSVRGVSNAWTTPAIEALGQHVGFKLSHPKYSRIPGASLIAGFLGAFAFGLFLIFIVDLGSVDDFAGRLRLASLLALCGVCIAAAATISSGWRHRYELAFIASLAAAIGASVMLAVALVGPASPAWFVGVAFVALGLAVASGITIWTSGPKRVTPLGRNLGVVTSVLSVGAILGVAQFWYQNVYLPGRAVAGIGLSATMSQGARVPGGGHVAEVTIEMSNAASAEAYVLASHYEVVGLRLAGGPPAIADGDATRPDAAVPGRDEPLGNEARVTQARVLRAGSFADTREFVESRGTASRRLAVTVPPGFHAAVVRAYVVAAKRTIDSLHFAPTGEHATGRFIVRSYDVYQDTLWHSLTRGDYQLITIEAKSDEASGYNCAGYPQVQAYFASAPGSAEDPPACDFASDRIGGFYGITWNKATAELQLKT